MQSGLGHWISINIPLYCDCKLSRGAYRNCSHENQTCLVIKLERNALTDANILNPFPHFHLVQNQSSESYDSDEGLYYCGAEQTKVDDRAYIRNVYITTLSQVALQFGFFYQLTNT